MYELYYILLDEAIKMFMKHDSSLMEIYHYIVNLFHYLLTTKNYY